MPGTPRNNLARGQAGRQAGKKVSRQSRRTRGVTPAKSLTRPCRLRGTTRCRGRVPRAGRTQAAMRNTRAPLSPLFAVGASAWCRDCRFTRWPMTGSYEASGLDALAIPSDPLEGTETNVGEKEGREDWNADAELQGRGEGGGGKGGEVMAGMSPVPPPRQGASAQLRPLVTPRPGVLGIRPSVLFRRASRTRSALGRSPALLAISLSPHQA